MRFRKIVNELLESSISNSVIDERLRVKGIEGVRRIEKKAREKEMGFSSDDAIGIGEPGSEVDDAINRNGERNSGFWYSDAIVNEGRSENEY